MRGRRIAALALALVLLGGCSWMEGSYVSVSPHQVGPDQTPDTTVHAVRSYTELRGALIGMIDSGTERALFSLAEYPREELAEDLRRAVDYAQGTYPVGAYAVESINCDLGTGLGSSALAVNIVYRRSLTQIEDIRTVRRITCVKEEVEDALDQFDSTLVLLVTNYQETDFSDLVMDYAQRNPDRVMEVPIVSAQVYPEQGENRVVELSFHYRTDREELRAMREQVQPVFSSAALYVSGQAGERVRFSQLHTFLMERFEYTQGTSLTPAYSLLCQGVGDSRAFAQVYAAMCGRIGLEAEVVIGKYGGENRWWNRICIDGIWYHLDLMAGQQFVPMTQEQMVGYEWDRTAEPTAG